MEPLAVAFVVFFFVTIVLGPILGAESRPEFLYPDRQVPEDVRQVRTAGDAAAAPVAR